MYDRFSGSITDVRGITVGQVQDEDARTGVSCICCGEQAVGAVAVRGAAPGTRETDLLRPEMTVKGPHAVVLAGGSAFGLAAADGVMQALWERGVGVQVGDQRVPIVPSAILMDLLTGNGNVRPDAQMGRRAFEAAEKEVKQGPFGAGCGATVGKLVPGATPSRGGVGTASLPLPGGGVIGAIAAVNAAGDIYHPHTGELLACGRDPEGNLIPFEKMLEGGGVPQAPLGNTTLAVLATDVPMDKAGLTRLASIAHDGFARVIRPVHTQVDGDTIFALSTEMAETEAHPVLLDALAAEVMARAVANAFLGAGA